jgi:hypothetical protein
MEERELFKISFFSYHAYQEVAVYKKLGTLFDWNS